MTITLTQTPPNVPLTSSHRTSICPFMSKHQRKNNETIHHLINQFSLKPHTFGQFGLQLFIVFIINESATYFQDLSIGL